MVVCLVGQQQGLLWWCTTGSADLVLGLIGSCIAHQGGPGGLLLLSHNTLGQQGPTPALISAWSPSVF